MEEGADLVTREQYIEMIIDASFRDPAELVAGFLSWGEQHTPTWREQGYDETWIRQRIEMAQIIGCSYPIHRDARERAEARSSPGRGRNP